MPPPPIPPETPTRRRFREWGIDLLWAGLGLLLGLIGNLDIRGILQPRLARSLADVSLWVTAFWPLMICFLALPLWKRYLDRRHEARLRQQARAAWFQPVAVWNGLQRRIRDSLVRGVDLRRRRMTPAQRVDVLKGEVRLLLSEVLTLIEGVEPRRSGTRYAVNVMRYHPVADLGGAFGARVRRAITLDSPPSPSDWGQIDGVLFLDPALSAASSERSGVRDRRLGELAFLIPAPVLLPNGQRAVLPGAPVAFADSALIGLTSAELVELCRSDEYACDPSGVDRLVRYLESPGGQSVRSFVSFPVYQEEGEDPVAILNIHSSAEDLLRGEELRELIFYLLRPPALTLITLIDELERYERATGLLP